jgi:peroxiredoxin
MTMKKISLLIGILCVTCIAPLLARAAEADFPKAIVQATLKVPDDAGVRSALGIKQKSGTFNLGDIEGSVVIVEIFSMYCPFCQRHAPATNALFQTIQADPATRGSVKLIGIGVGNTSYEVNFFKKKYGILFPLFDDANSSVLNSLKGVRTPYYFGIRKNNGALQVFFAQQGAFDDPKAFLKTVLDKSRQP